MVDKLGDLRKAGGEQETGRLSEQVAYEHWHRMLFARFLAENDLLMYPDPVDPVAISLEECEDLAVDEGAKNGWELAARYASQMLPQIFRLDSPVFELNLPPEHQQRLERLLTDLPVEVFTASDSLGWVYQFWQAKKKDEVNASEVKIGARELPAVTQLFTEPYMVSFLLDNSLGAWWCQKTEDRSQKPDGGRNEVREKLQSAESEEELREFFSLPGVPLEYLRFVKEKTVDKAKNSDTPPPPSPSGRGVGGEGKKRLPADILKYARELRHNQTDAEQLLWQFLRDRRFLGKKFRRQHPVGRYILDFYCYEEKLAIELDGGQHNEPVQEKRDKKRSEFLNKKGIKVLRFWNNEVLQQTEAVLEALYLAISPSPQPLSQGGRGFSDASAEVKNFTWRPAAGSFNDWPDDLAELKTLDPCCGSGHFLVAALLMLVPMRMELEELSAREAVDAVLRENIHGLELDQRCVELAAFALALTAWRYPDAGGYRPLPEMHIACSGLSVSVAKDEWKQLALDKHNLRIALDWMYEEFKDAPVLGSLLNPAKGNAAKLVEWEELRPMLDEALSQEQSDDEQEMGVVAHGLAKAAGLLAGKYHWVITNVPYLARGKQSETLMQFCDINYPQGKRDLAYSFFQRIIEFQDINGVATLVCPQSWLFQPYLKSFRKWFLYKNSLEMIAGLGAGAFETISGEIVNVSLIITSQKNNLSTGNYLAIDLNNSKNKSNKLTSIQPNHLWLKEAMNAKDFRIVLSQQKQNSNKIGDYTRSVEGLSTGDKDRFLFKFWEIDEVSKQMWSYYQNSPKETCSYTGMSEVIRWENGCGVLSDYRGARIQGHDAWGRKGVLSCKMGNIRSTIYLGGLYDKTCVALTSTDEKILKSIYKFSQSYNYNELVRNLDARLCVATSVFELLPLDILNDIIEFPKPYSNDPTQWIFHGHPSQTDFPLQAAVARLLGYRWPAELDKEMELSDDQRALVQKCGALLALADDDGIVCIPPVRGEAAAADRLQNLLAAAFGDEWSTDKLASLLTQAEHKGKTLETWLRDKFFTQHCKLFHHRPFIWHIWDGLHDGFAALVNYHKLDHKTLETLIYTYLGDWITRQKDDIASSIDSAQEKLAAAESLKKKLELILEGEDPHDIFVRWKPIDKQAIGWNPDLGDGVRLNIRPFLTVGDVKKKNAGLFPFKPNIKWNKDRGKDVPSAPWYQLGLQYEGKEGDRINDHHLTLEKKQTAREETRDE